MDAPQARPNSKLPQGEGWGQMKLVRTKYKEGNIGAIVYVFIFFFKCVHLNTMIPYL